MGTSAACMWATIYYGRHEVKTLIPKFKSQLYDETLIRWIDDIFGLWCCQTCKSREGCIHWKEFVDSLPFGLLTWSTPEPSQSVVFLDMTVSIEGGRVVTCTYQKPMNLYLYIPPASNHSPKQTRAIIFQLMKRYRLQNTKFKDYAKYTMLLYRRLLARGHLPDKTWPYFREAHQKIQLQLESQPEQQQQESTLPRLNPNNLPTNEPRPSYLHFVYDKYDVPGRVVQQLHEKHCSSFEEALRLLPPKVCYSRPKTIGNLATQAILHQPPGKPASHFMGEFQKGLDP